MPAGGLSAAGRPNGLGADGSGGSYAGGEDRASVLGIEKGQARNRWSRHLKPNDSLLTSNPLPNTGQIVVVGSPQGGWTLTNWAGTPILA